MAALVAAFLSFVAPASAHGPPPSAVELLSSSEQHAMLVRLTPGGIAQRVADGFRFVCPEAWGGDVLAPAAAVPSGPTLVLSDTLFVIEQDGRVVPHAIQSGTGMVAASQEGAVFGIFKHEGQYELRRVTATTNELVRVLDQPFGALVASADQLSLLRWLGNTLVLDTISLTGELRESVSWSVPSTVAYARLSLAADQLYVSIWGRSAPWVSLGRMVEGSYEPLLYANAEIAGPVSGASGTLVAVDGTLQKLGAGGTVDTFGSRVTCLGAVDLQPYACVHGDLLRIESSGLGAPLFELSSLLEPVYESLPAAARSDCATRWLDLRDDVAMARSSGAASDAAVIAADTVSADAGAALGTSHARGCSLAPGPAERPSLFSLLVLSLFIVRRRRSCCGLPPRLETAAFT